MLNLIVLLTKNGNTVINKIWEHHQLQAKDQEYHTDIVMIMGLAVVDLVKDQKTKKKKNLYGRPWRLR